MDDNTEWELLIVEDEVIRGVREEGDFNSSKGDQGKRKDKDCKVA